MNFEFNWTTISLLVFGVWAFAVVIRWHFGKSSFDLQDFLIDHTTNRASIDKCILAAFAALSIWVVVQWTLDGKNVETLLLGTLGIFVAKRAVDNISRQDKTPPDARTLERKDPA